MATEVKRMAGWAFSVCVRVEQGPAEIISRRPGQVASRVSRRGVMVRGKAVAIGVSIPGFWVPWPVSLHVSGVFSGGYRVTHTREEQGRFRMLGNSGIG